MYGIHTQHLHVRARAPKHSHAKNHPCSSLSSSRYPNVNTSSHGLQFSVAIVGSLDTNSLKLVALLRYYTTKHILLVSVATELYYIAQCLSQNDVIFIVTGVTIACVPVHPRLCDPCDRSIHNSIFNRIYRASDENYLTIITTTLYNELMVC